MSYYIVSEIVKNKDKSEVFDKIYHGMKKADPAVRAAVSTALKKKPGIAKLIGTLLTTAEKQTKKESVPKEIRNKVM